MNDVRVLLAGGTLQFVFQPIVDLGDGGAVGFEGLTRMDGVASPVELFREAGAQGLLLDLELHAISSILARAPVLPPTAYVAVNASPSTLLSGAVPATVGPFPLDRLVVEISEREVIADYAVVRAGLAALWGAGIRVAIDDVGAGAAPLLHLVELAPDIIKLDQGLLDGIAGDPARQAMVRRLCDYAEDVGAVVVAECVESLALVELLRALGVRQGQGYALGSPADADFPSR